MSVNFSSKTNNIAPVKDLNAVNSRKENTVNYQHALSNTKNSDKKGLKVTASIVAAGIGALAILKVAPLLSSRGKINDLLIKFGQKSKEKASYLNTKFVSSIFYKLKAVTNFYKTALNITSLKDAGFKKITDEIPVIGKAFKKVTAFSEKIAMNAVEKKYLKTNKQFNKLYKAFASANLNLKENDAQKCENLINNFRKILNNSFSNTEVELRLNNLQSSLEGLDKKVYNSSFKKAKSFLSSKRSYTNCLAEQISLAEKNRNFNFVNDLRANITNNSKNDINILKHYINSINSLLDPLADNTIDAMKKVDSALKSFNKKNTEETRKVLLESLKNLNKLVPNQEIQKEFAKSLNNLNLTRTGELQNILRSYKEILPSKEYAKLEKIAEKAIKSLDNSVNMETNRYFEKIRDLEIGSAPTDVVSIASSLAAVGIGLSKADGKDEKISAALKFGIPALGAVAVSSICTLSLVSAGPSLAIGLISGFMINKIGSFADEIRKALKDKE